MPWPLSAAWPNANDRSADWAPGAFRRSELVALDVADIAESKDGLLVTIRRSKTDQEGDDLAEQSPRGKCLMSHYRRCHRAGRPAPWWQPCRRIWPSPNERAQILEILSGSDLHAQGIAIRLFFQGPPACRMGSSCRMFREEPLARAMRFPSGASPTVAPNLYMELSNRSPCCIELPEGDRAPEQEASRGHSPSLHSSYQRGSCAASAASLNPKKARPPATTRPIRSTNPRCRLASPYKSAPRWNSATKVKITPATIENVFWSWAIILSL